jgi:hypothetical protein
MTVTVNGKMIHSGSVEPVRVPLGSAGRVHTVSVRISTQGESFQKTVTIVPQDVVLVAEPLSSAPPLYAGKSFVPLGGSVRIVALADMRTAQGTRINPAQASYKWTVGGATLSSSSGIGKRTLLLSSPLRYRSSTVSVVVTSPSGELVGGDSLSFSAHEARLRFYEQDPLLGIRFERALSRSYAITGTEATIFAAPFSLPMQNVPVIEWFLQGARVHSGNAVTLRPEGSGRGATSLSVVASSGSAPKATETLSLFFENTANLFGL